MEKMRCSYVRAGRAIFACALVACTSGIDPNRGVAGSVNQLGGTVAMAGGTAAVQVGAGALSAPVVIAVSPATPPAPLPATAVSKVIEFTPHGTVFTVPAKVTIAYDKTVAAQNLHVLRLANDKATQWEVVGGAKFQDGVATFETTQFSFYTITTGLTCPAVNNSVACTTSCQCCGGASCVNMATDPRNCGACGNACGASSFCSGASQCTALSMANLCANKTMVEVLGEILDLTGPNPGATTDADAAASVGAALQANCGATVTITPQATSGVLDPCTDAPLYGGGTTLVIAGGKATERAAIYLEDIHAAPLTLTYGGTQASGQLKSAGGTLLRDVPVGDVSASHDYAIISLAADPQRGAVLLHVWGLDWRGTQAATWYFVNQVMPAIKAGNPPFQRYVLIEWTDNGDGIAGANDTYKVLAQDVP